MYFFTKLIWNSCRTVVYLHKNFIRYEKVKVIPVQTMKLVEGVGGIAPFILTLALDQKS